MNPVKLAVIQLEPPLYGYDLFFRQKIAGIPLFQRLLLTLSRAGIENSLIISRDLDERERHKIQRSIVEDPRFQGKLLWIDTEEIQTPDRWEALRTFAGGRDFLLLDGNVVTTAKTVQGFIWKSRAEAEDESAVPTFLKVPSREEKTLRLLPAEKLEMLKSPKPPSETEESGRPVTFTEDRYFVLPVTNASSAKQAEKRLLRDHKNYYSQLMDIWFNSFFSLKISSQLVKLPVTPNQLTLFGLVIGLVSGWFFAQGDYRSGLWGALFMVGTAIWDCCDGDVARLKFMESDFGETLDTLCDNIINVFIFSGIAIGVARSDALAQAVVPFILLAIGGGMIFALIYFPGGGKGNFFKDSRLFKAIEILASRNFIYVILLFAVFDQLGAFLWIAGFGSNIFGWILFISREKIANAAAASTE